MPRHKREIPWLDWIDGIAYVHWYDAAAKRTRRLSLRTGDVGEAQARYAAFLTEGADVYSGRPNTGAYTCGAALDAYEAEHVRRVNQPATQRRVAQNRAMLMQFFGETPVREVDEALCRRYAEARRAGKVGRVAGDSTIWLELTVLKTAINKAVKWKRLRAEDVPTMELPPAPPTRERWLTKDELAVLMAAADKHPLVGPFVHLAYWTGARRTAIETLTVFQVDLENNRIFLNPEGRRQTTKRRPVVPIFSEIRPLVERLLREAKAAGRTRLLPPGLVYFPFHIIAREAGFTDVSPHTLRHTRATHLLQDGRNPWAVAKLLGDTLKTVELRYGHSSAEYLMEVL